MLRVADGRPQMVMYVTCAGTTTLWLVLASARTTHLVKAAGNGLPGLVGARLPSAPRAHLLDPAAVMNRTEGVLGLYRGFNASVMMFVPSSAIWWGSYGGCAATSPNLYARPRKGSSVKATNRITKD